MLTVHRQDVGPDIAGRLGAPITEHTSDGGVGPSLLSAVPSFTGVSVYAECDFSMEVMVYFKVIFTHWRLRPHSLYESLQTLKVIIYPQVCCYNNNDKKEPM